MKRFLCLILTLVFAFSCMAVTANATESELNADIIENAAENVFAVFAGADENAEVIISPALTEKITADKLTARELADEMSGVILVESTAVTANNAAKAIADSAEYTVTILEDGSTTVYIAVDLTENPDLFNLPVMIDAVKEMYANTEYLTNGKENLNLLSYEDIAGELALHMIVYTVLNPYVDNLTGSFADYYNSAKVAELNVDESRVPRSFIEFIGSIIMDILSFFANLF